MEIGFNFVPVYKPKDSLLPNIASKSISGSKQTVPVKTITKTVPVKASTTTSAKVVSKTSIKSSPKNVPNHIEQTSSTKTVSLSDIKDKSSTSVVDSTSNNLHNDSSESSVPKNDHIASSVSNDANDLMMNKITSLVTDIETMKDGFKIILTSQVSLLQELKDIKSDFHNITDQQTKLKEELDDIYKKLSVLDYNKGKLDDITSKLSVLDYNKGKLDDITSKLSILDQTISKDVNNNIIASELRLKKELRTNFDSMSRFQSQVRDQIMNELHKKKINPISEIGSEFARSILSVDSSGNSPLSGLMNSIKEKAQESINTIFEDDISEQERFVEIKDEMNLQPQISFIISSSSQNKFEQKLLEISPDPSIIPEVSEKVSIEQIITEEDASSTDEILSETPSETPSESIVSQNISEVTTVVVVSADDFF
jgi:hypothetical protein